MFLADIGANHRCQSSVPIIGANHRNLVQSPVATGTVGGLPFARGAWSGIGQRTGKAFEGIVHISVTPSRYHRNPEP